MVKEYTCDRSHRNLGFDPRVRKIPWRMTWQPNSSVLAWRIPWSEELGGATVHGVANS